MFRKDGIEDLSRVLSGNVRRRRRRRLPDETLPDETLPDGRPVSSDCRGWDRAESTHLEHLGVPVSEWGSGWGSGNPAPPHPRQGTSKKHKGKLVANPLTDAAQLGEEKKRSGQMMCGNTASGQCLPQSGRQENFVCLLCLAPVYKMIQVWQP